MVLNLATWFALHTLFRAVTPWSFGPLRFDTGVIVTLAASSALGMALHAAGLIG